jgi:hypothetical protein
MCHFVRDLGWLLGSSHTESGLGFKKGLPIWLQAKGSQLWSNYQPCSISRWSCSENYATKTEK